MEHLLFVSLPMALGVIILLLVFRRWLIGKKQD